MKQVLTPVLLPEFCFYSRSTAGSIYLRSSARPAPVLGGVCQRRCVTVEESLQICRTPSSTLPIDLHLPDTVTDGAHWPIAALETDRRSFTGEMRLG